MLKKVEEPKKEEVKRTKVKISKPKKYEDLPEIPDYERPELEIYEESEFEPSKLERAVDEPTKQTETPTISVAEIAEPSKNGLPKVSVVRFVNNQYITQDHFIVFFLLFCAPIDFDFCARFYSVI